MHISVETDCPMLSDVRPHYCMARGGMIGLRFSSDEWVRDIYCPWCGGHVPIRGAGRDYARSVRPESYDGPLCPHGFPDVPCVELAGVDAKAQYELFCGAIREFRAAALAERYGCAPAVVAWVRPCPQCRKATARQRRPLLRYELERVAARLSGDLKSAEADLYSMRDDLRKLHEALFELESLARAALDERARCGFVYLIGHARAVKIGWSDKHPLAPGGRLADLQVASAVFGAPASR